MQRTAWSGCHLLFQHCCIHCNILCEFAQLWLVYLWSFRHFHTANQVQDLVEEFYFYFYKTIRWIDFIEAPLSRAEYFLSCLSRPFNLHDNASNNKTSLTNNWGQIYTPFCVSLIIPTLPLWSGLLSELHFGAWPFSRPRGLAKNNINNKKWW